MKSQEISKSLKISSDYGKIPLYFIPNEGQTHDKALFYAKASRYTLWLTKQGLVFDSIKIIKKGENESRPTHPKNRNNPEGFTYERDVSRLIFLNSKKKPEMVPVNRTEHKVNYFIGKDKSKWRTNIQTSRAVLYKELYRNIDLRVYGIEKQIEYDFIVKPGGEVSDISFEYRDVEKTEIDKGGNLIVETKFGELEHAKPECYQVIGGERVEVEAMFKRIENNTYGFKVKEYNENYELIIDPLVLVYSTYLGGWTGDYGHSIAVDSEGGAYVTGMTNSLDFPTQNPIQGNFAGGGTSDVFITKVSFSGTALVYSTYLGGSGLDEGDGIAVDSEGAAYVTGETESTDFPTQNPIQGTNAGDHDVFITKVNSSGNALVYSTYLGGSYYDYGHGIAVDSEGAACVTGMTNSLDFPTQNPIQGNFAGLNDAFITKVNSSGDALVYSTYLGGSDGEGGWGIAVDSAGAAYVTGGTGSTDFPTQNPIQGSLAEWMDVFITKINSAGDALVYSTYLGGLGYDYGYGIAVDSENAVYVTGGTESTDFPTQNPIQGTNAGGDDVFITKLYFTCSLTITAGSGGTTEPSPETYTYDEGTEVTITAIPDNGYEFSNWSGDASGTDNPITITMDGDKSITANFRAKEEPGKKGGCFIATATYGSPLHPYVKILRDFRDKWLMPNRLGREMVNFYYKYSPFIADLISKHKLLKVVVRINLLSIVAFSYSMIHLGPIITAVLIVLILILPLLLISFYRRKLRPLEAKRPKALASLD